MSGLEIWGGVECTVNRVGSVYYDQCERIGHFERREDLPLFAALGIKRLRYPFLWETAADWSEFDRRADLLRENGLQPIAGLLHHGSGPLHTSLLDPKFPTQFAAYAGEFAARYPWIEDYTPINEPLTTARFSGLYGWWYPHHRNDSSFVRALVHQIQATILAMREIRRVNPNARLIQTDDLGRAQSTRRLHYQCVFENQRRWLSYDFLCGKVDTTHPLYNYLKRSGFTAVERDWFVQNPCPPDVIGVNHYLLSNRFLDHRLKRYPKEQHGGNGIDRYVDAAAVDVPGVETPAPSELYREAWERYHLPIAATEVHLRGHRESQMRWLNEIYQAARELRADGVDFRAITAWSLLGAFDWNSLCTARNEFYEPGVFDLANPQRRPRATALAKLVRQIARDESPDHPLVQRPGWWRKAKVPPSKTRPILITGAQGVLAQGFARVCDERGIEARALSRAELDITDRARIDEVIGALKPWAVINAAGYVRVDDAEKDRERCFRENVDGPGHMAEVCRQQAVRFLSFSSDLVFDGHHPESYRESSPVAPLNVYGESKAESERRILAINPDAMVVRTSSFFGPWDRYNFVTQSLRHWAQRQKTIAASDIRVSPTYVPDLVHTALDLLIDDASGLIHLINAGEVSWADWARMSLQTAQRVFRGRGFDLDLVEEKPQSELCWSARRPRHSVLTSERVHLMPSFEDAMSRYFAQLDPQVIYGESR